jgi:zinc D-Ala-D-Ala carboxypeptidase
MYTSKYFSLAETECKCGCGKDLADAFKEICDRLREQYGKPLPMTSGARCASYNQKVSTTGPQGPHTTGHAADFGVSRADAHELLRVAMDMLIFQGIGIQQKGDGRFIHLDTLNSGPRPNVWSY